MKTIRPYQLFTVLDAPPSGRTAHVQIPARRGAGGVSLLEMFLIIAATRVVAARRIFEFGTFLGSTTLNLALNTPDDASIVTLDLDEAHTENIQQDVADAPLTVLHLASSTKLDFMDSNVAGKIRTLTGNSVSYDFSEYEGTMDFVFIDGGHDHSTVKSDTSNAFTMARRDAPSCIMWHDYGNREYPDLTTYLDEIAHERSLFHIGDTMLCAWFGDSDNPIRARILGE